jgi:putative phosphotransacetylase
MEQLKIIVEASARHLHITGEALEILFGKGYALRRKRDLSQPGEFLTEEKVRIDGPRGSIDGISVLGPLRKAVQVELSLSDARKLGISPPLRLSGDVSGSAAVTVTGPAGTLNLAEGAVIAKRHLHLIPETAARYHIKDGQTVSVALDGERALVFGEIAVRVNPNFADRLHIDYDEANAAGVSSEVLGTVIVT